MISISLTRNARHLVQWPRTGRCVPSITYIDIIDINRKSYRFTPKKRKRNSCFISFYIYIYVIKMAWCLINNQTPIVLVMYMISISKIFRFVCRSFLWTTFQHICERNKRKKKQKHIFFSTLAQPSHKSTESTVFFSVCHGMVCSIAQTTNCFQCSYAGFCFLFENRQRQRVCAKKRSLNIDWNKFLHLVSLQALFFLCVPRFSLGLDHLKYYNLLRLIRSAFFCLLAFHFLLYIYLC